MWALKWDHLKHEPKTKLNHYPVFHYADSTVGAIFVLAQGEELNKGINEIYKLLHWVKEREVSFRLHFLLPLIMHFESSIRNADYLFYLKLVSSTLHSLPHFVSVPIFITIISIAVSRNARLGTSWSCITIFPYFVLESLIILTVPYLITYLAKFPAKLGISDWLPLNVCAVLHLFLNWCTRPLLG